MKKKYYLLPFIVGLFTLLVCLFPTRHAQADNISLNGSSADSAIVTNKKGENVTGQQLNRWESFSVNYHWSVPEGTTIKAGDTAQFEIPNNIEILEDTQFDVVDQNGNVIGTFSLPKGSHTGTLTFNDYIPSHHITNLSGTLTVAGNGTENIEYKDWVINKTGWVNGEDKPTWDIVYNPDQKELTNVTITDTLDGKQVLDPNSIVIQYGWVDENNQFHMESEVTNPIEQGLVTVTDDGFVAHFDKLDKAIQIIYTTTPTTRLNANISNSASGKSDELGVVSDESTIYVGGSGTVDGSTSISSSSLTTTSEVIPPSSSTVPTLPTEPSLPESSTSETDTTTTSIPESSTTESSTSETDTTTTSSSESTSTDTNTSETETTSSSSSESSSTPSGSKPLSPIVPPTTSSDDTETTSQSNTMDKNTTEHTTQQTTGQHTNGSRPSSSSVKSVNRQKPQRVQDTIYESVRKAEQQHIEKQSGVLPQTGNKKQYRFMFIGLGLIIIIIAISGVMIYQKRHY